MGEEKGVIVFTNQNVVVKSFNKIITIEPIPKYIKKLEKRITSKEYNVYFNIYHNTFIIMEENIEYDVILPSIESVGKQCYTSIVSCLLNLAVKEHENSSIQEKEATKEAKIKAMEESNYEDIEELEDLELYLDYLKKEKIKEAKTNEEKVVIKTKIFYLESLINKKKSEEERQKNDPLGLNDHIYGFIHDLSVKASDLNDKDKLIALGMTKEILEDYKRLKSTKPDKNRLLVLGSSKHPMNIIRRIVNVELFISESLRNNNVSFSEILKEIANEITNIERGNGYER